MVRVGHSSGHEPTSESKMDNPTGRRRKRRSKKRRPAKIPKRIEFLPGLEKSTQYIDESGHDSLFDRRGKSIVGLNRGSHTFMVGMAEIANESAASEQLEELRHALMADVGLKDIFSLRPEAKKTALCFHAKNDHRIVRDRVFDVVRHFDVSVCVAFRRKSLLVWKAKNRAYMGGDYEAKPHNMYDNLILRVAQRRLQSPGHHHVLIAKRGTRIRTQALQKTLLRASGGQRENRRLTFDPISPSESAGLQVVDYYLWALQRMIERGEDRYFELVKSGYREILDLDNRDNTNAGEIYNQDNPLTLKKLKPVTSG
jgi:hypothetical protein